MSNQANVLDIVRFLERMKSLISAGKYDFVPRRKNMQALAKYGLTILDAKNEMIRLVPEIIIRDLNEILIPIDRAIYGSLKKI